jgi:hypothetical protein
LRTQPSEAGSQKILEGFYCDRIARPEAGSCRGGTD